MYSGLLFYDFENLHGASLHADTAGDTLGGGAFAGCDHDLHGADLYTLAARSAELLIDHVDTGLGVLRNSTGLTDLGTFAALNTGHGLCAATLCHDTDAGQIFIEFLVESSGARTHTLQASHALGTLLNSQLLHKKKSFLFVINGYIIQQQNKNSNG